MPDTPSARMLRALVMHGRGRTGQQPLPLLPRLVVNLVAYLVPNGRNQLPLVNNMRTFTQQH